jgi:hypothetical protein
MRDALAYVPKTQQSMGSRGAAPGPSATGSGSGGCNAAPCAAAAVDWFRWRDQLEGLLLENAGKPARERLTLIRIFEELRALGYEGSYDAVCRYAKRWRAERGAVTAEAFVPLSFAPGEAYQYDWSHKIVLINGVPLIRK